jgi:LuxR family maltose regulon positive regulatory protein
MNLTSTMSRAGAERPPNSATRADLFVLPGGLVEAKLLMPRVRAGTIHRTRLLGRLRAASDRRIISIVAPAGYGKTSLLVGWAAAEPRAVAWLTADAGDDDPVVFLTYLAAAIGRSVPLDPAIFAAIASPAVSDRAVIGRLLTAIAGASGPILIAIDDAHRLTDRACLDALSELVTYVPEGSQVALAGRTPPDLPFARWHADGSVLEMGPADLAMDEQEAARLGRALGLPLSAEATARVWAQTEGWPALMALAASDAGRDATGGSRTAAGSDRLIAAYLHAEVVASRTPAEITFLTRTSILDGLSGPLCDAVVGTAGSSTMLDALAPSILLVDSYGGSYRYHPLLRDFLRGELAAREPALVPELHRRAAGWFEATGALDLAVDHAFMAGDLDLAARLAGTGMLLYHWSGRRATTRGWFMRFADEELVDRPWLAVLAAWEEGGAGKATAAWRLADIAEHSTFAGAPPDGTASFESGRAMLRAAMARLGMDDARANASRAVELEPDGSPWRDFALWQLAITLHALGDLDGAEAALDASIRAARSAGTAGLGHCVLGHRALLAIERQDWHLATALAREMADGAVAAKVEGYLSATLAAAARIRVAIHRGDIEAARRDLVHATGLRPLLTPVAPAVSILAILGLARAHVAVDDPAGARTLLAQAGQVIRQRPDLGVLPGEVQALRDTLASQPLTLTGGATSLTAAELRVLALLPYYLSFKEIGQRLGVKATTVKTHALAIYGKLGASTRGEAIDLAVDAGLLERFAPAPAASAITEDAPPGSR